MRFPKLSRIARTAMHGLDFMGRRILVVLWLLEYVLITSFGMSTFPVLPLLFGLALLTFIMVDYFSVAVITILLTIIINTSLVAPVPGSTRAWIVDAVWLGAVAVAAFKLLYPFNERTKPLYSETEVLFLPSKLRHDLQTPISVIRGYCEAIFRANKAVSSTIQDNVQAIYRNAQQLEKLLTISFDEYSQSKGTRALETDTVDLATLLQQAVAMTSDLMNARRINTKIHVDYNLTDLSLNSLYVRQVMLNILRTIALVTPSTTSENSVAIRASAHAQTVEINFIASSATIHDVINNSVWQQTQKLLDYMNAHSRVQQPNDGPTTSSALVVSIPLSAKPAIHKANVPTARPSLLVICESEVHVGFFKEQFASFDIVAAKNIEAVDQVLQCSRDEIAAVLSVQALTDLELHKIRALIGMQTPILICPTHTAEELLQQLRVSYLGKPLDFNKLSKLLETTIDVDEAPTRMILIVEDNPDSAQMLAHMVASISPTFNTCTVSLANDVLCVLDQVPVSAILVDQSLPDMSGINLIQRIRQEERYGALRIVLMSARPTIDEILPKMVLNRLIVDQPSGLEYILPAFADLLKKD